jgi:hypothetical protein
VRVWALLESLLKEEEEEEEDDVKFIGVEYGGKKT